MRSAWRDLCTSVFSLVHFSKRCLLELGLGKDHAIGHPDSPDTNLGSRGGHHLRGGRRCRPSSHLPLRSAGQLNRAEYLAVGPDL
jgi:hypothetical protein